MTFEELKLKFIELKEKPDAVSFDTFCNDVVSYLDGLKADKMLPIDRANLKAKLFELKNIAYELKNLKEYLFVVANTNTVENSVQQEQSPALNETNDLDNSKVESLGNVKKLTLPDKQAA